MRVVQLAPRPAAPRRARHHARHRARRCRRRYRRRHRRSDRCRPRAIARVSLSCASSDCARGDDRARGDEGWGGATSARDRAHHRARHLARHHTRRHRRRHHRRHRRSDRCRPRAIARVCAPMAGVLAWTIRSIDRSNRCLESVPLASHLAASLALRSRLALRASARGLKPLRGRRACVLGANCDLGRGTTHVGRACLHLYIFDFFCQPSAHNRY